jgi:hypothetical protein
LVGLRNQAQALLERLETRGVKSVGILVRWADRVRT